MTHTVTPTDLTPSTPSKGGSSGFNINDLLATEFSVEMLVLEGAINTANGENALEGSVANTTEQVASYAADLNNQFDGLLEAEAQHMQTLTSASAISQAAGQLQTDTAIVNNNQNQQSNIQGALSQGITNQTNAQSQAIQFCTMVNQILDGENSLVATWSG